MTNSDLKWWKELDDERKRVTIPMSAKELCECLDWLEIGEKAMRHADYHDRLLRLHGHFMIELERRVNSHLKSTFVQQANSTGGDDGH